MTLTIRPQMRKSNPKEIKQVRNRKRAVLKNLQIFQTKVTK